MITLLLLILCECVCACLIVCLWCARARGALVLVVFSCCVRDVIFTVEVVHCIILFEYVTHNTQAICNNYSNNEPVHECNIYFSIFYCK